MKDFFISMLEKLGMAFWIEVSTEVPRCIYYFGPFFSRSDADQAKPGFEEDLIQEGASGITSMMFQRPTPDILTLELDQYPTVHGLSENNELVAAGSVDRTPQSV
jgi:Domain of unknown function (DUF1816)